MLWYIGHLFGCRLRRREKGHGVSIRTALRLLYHMRPTRCYRQSGKDFASKIVQPARGRRGPAAVSGCFRSAGRFLCSTSAAASLPRHGAGAGRRPYRVAFGRLAASFAPPPLPQASHVTGPARAGGHIGLLPVGWPLPLLYLRCRKPPMSWVQRHAGPAAVSGYFRPAGRFLCSTSAAASLPRHGAGTGPAAVSGCFRLAGRFLCCTSAAASLPRHGSSGTLVRRKTCAL